MRIWHVALAALLIGELWVWGSAINKWNVRGGPFKSWLLRAHVMLPFIIPWGTASLVATAVVRDAQRVSSRVVRHHGAHLADEPCFVQPSELDGMADRIDRWWFEFRSVSVPERIRRGLAVAIRRFVRLRLVMWVRAQCRRLRGGRLAALAARFRRPIGRVRLRRRRVNGSGTVGDLVSTWKRLEPGAVGEIEAGDDGGQADEVEPEAQAQEEQRESA